MSCKKKGNNPAESLIDIELRDNTNIPLCHVSRPYREKYILKKYNSIK